MGRIILSNLLLNNFKNNFPLKINTTHYSLIYNVILYVLIELIALTYHDHEF